MTTFDSININNIINNNNNNINNKNKNRTTSLNYNIFKTIDNITNNENFELYSKAQDLLSEAEKLCFKYREKEVEESQAKEFLIKACPGFSKENYNNAWSHGMHVSMW